MTYKIIIGTHVMFYEVEMLPEFINSIVNAIKYVDDSKSNITCDFQFNVSEYFEEIDTALITKSELIDKFKLALIPLQDSGCIVNYNIYDGTSPRTMVEYRRDLNYLNCNHYDLIIWGETDCLIPRESFVVLDHLHHSAVSSGIHRYIATFSIRKMWDSTWEILEHPFVQGKPWHSYATEPDLAFSMPYSIRYNMSLEEMYHINDKTETLDVRTIDYPKFDGSCLVISTDLIKCGANIPPGFFGLAAEDTAFMYSCQQILGKDYKQFIIKNILKVHNRNHARKRLYIKDSHTAYQHAHISADKGDWFDRLASLNKENLNRIFFDKSKKVLTYRDYTK